MMIRKIGALSLGKVQGAISALLGLIIGAITAFFWVLTVLLGIASSGQNAEGTGALVGFGLLFGIGALILYPIILGIVGFIGGLITALFYNLVARFVGGLEIEVEDRSRVY